MTGLRNIQMERLSLKVRRVPGVVAVLAMFIAPAFVAWAQEPGDARSTASGVYTGDQVKRGQAIFSRKCQECHGETLDLVALVLRANGYPAGSRALARADELDSIAVAPPEGKR